MRPLERKLLKFSALVLILFVVAAIFMPVFATGYPVPSGRRCLRNLKSLTLGLVMYVNDHDERFAARDVWMDGIQPYVKDVSILHDPELKEKAKGAYGYAFNGALSGAKPPTNPEKVPMAYDSVSPIRNASDLVTSLPSPGRHKGANMIGYADGHAKRVEAP